MLGKLLSKIRKDKNYSKFYVAKNSNLDPGYITHVENGERIPSHNALKKICLSLDVPYQQVSLAYNKTATKTQLEDNLLNLIPYTSVPAIDKLGDLINCPTKFGTASFAFKVFDDSMEPSILKGSYAYVEQCSLPANKDICLFYIDGKFLIRRFFSTNASYIFKADNPSVKPLYYKKNDSILIVGKILGTNDDF